jgi:ribosomal subunit interface protein
MGVAMDIIFKSRRTSIPERFRQHAVGKLAKIEKLDQKAIRIDVEVSMERNPRQTPRRERVELTIRSRGPVIRAEAEAGDRYTALDMAFAKLEARLRRACDRRKLKVKHADREAVRAGAPAQAPVVLADPGPARPVLPDLPAVLDPGPPNPRSDEDGQPVVVTAGGSVTGTRAPEPTRPGDEAQGAEPADLDGEEAASAHLVPIQMEGDGPVVVREKLHSAAPMTIEQALLEMELVGHDFYLFHDCDCDRFSVVYRRRGYDYGVIRLMETPA